MSVYIVTGKLGSGKTLSTVGKIRDYLAKGKPVATNLDIFMEYLSAKDNSRRFVIRLPDHPSVDDLNALGRGQGGVEESDNGLIVLDECGTWLNTRDWSDKGRQALIDWMLHSRKLGWDVILIIQDLSMIDKQIRTSLAEFVVYCRRLDRMAIPFLSAFAGLFGLKLKMPKLHVAFVKYGAAPDAPVVERWAYMAKHLYSAYDTKQVYRPNQIIRIGKEEIAMPHVGMHCTLSRWHLVGRYKTVKPSIFRYPLGVIAYAFLRLRLVRPVHLGLGPEPVRRSRLAPVQRLEWIGD